MRFNLDRERIAKEPTANGKAMPKLPASSVVARTGGALRNAAPLLSAKEERAAAERASAKAVVRRIGDSNISTFCVLEMSGC